MNLKNMPEKTEERVAELLAEAFDKEYEGKIKFAESIYLQLIEEEDEKKRWLSLALLAEMYKRNNMYLKMDKIGKQLCTQYPDNYEGFHIRLESLMARKKYKDVKAVIDCIPEDMKLLYICLNDFVKYHIAVEEYQMAEDKLKELAIQYGDLRSMICLGLLMISRRQTSNVLELCNFILTNIEEDNLLYGYYTRVLMSIAEMSENENNWQKIDKIIDELLRYMKGHDIEEKEMETILNNIKKDGLNIELQTEDV